MSDEQKYSELLKEIGELISEKNRTIFLLTYENEKLKEKLKEIERA